MDLPLWSSIVLWVVAVVCIALDMFSVIFTKSIELSSPTKARYLSSSFSGRRLIALLSDRSRSVITGRMLSVICKVLAASSITVAFIDLLSPIWVGVVVDFVVAIVAIFTFSELIALPLAMDKPERKAAACSVAFTLFYYLLYPLASIGLFFGRLFSKTLNISSEPEISERDLRAVVTDVYDEGAIEKEEHDLIQNSLNFDDKTVDRVMTPIERATVAYDSMSIGQIRQLFIDNGYSRMPYIDSDTGEVQGVIFQRDFYEMLLSGSTDISEAVKPALFLNSSISASLALKRLQRFRQHMALVRDGDGKTVGLITVEDLVEELVGEIEDESDAEDIQEETLRAIRTRTSQAARQESEIIHTEEDDDILVHPETESEEESEDEGVEEEGGEEK